MSGFGLCHFQSAKSVRQRRHPNMALLTEDDTLWEDSL